MPTKKKTKSARCKVCRVMLPCWEHCQDTLDGRHQANSRSMRPIEGDGPDWTVDVDCQHCGQSGSVAVDPKAIQWG
jgi:hypothetical protein